MPTRIGMDVSAVRQSAALIDARAGDLDRLVGSVDGLVAHLAGEWFGAAAVEFHESWTHQHRGALIGLVAALHAYARTARANADEQDRTSSADRDPLEAARNWWDLAIVGLDGFSSGTEMELTALAKAFPEALRLDGAIDVLDHAGSVFAYLGLAGDSFKVAWDGLHGSFTSSDTTNDELNVTLDALTIGATIAGGPLAGAAVGVLAMGVNVLEQHDPALTADAFRLSPIGQGFEVGGAILDHVRHGDFNPVDIASQISYDNQAAFSDLSHQAASASEAAASWVGRTADHMAAGAGHAVGNLMHDVGSWAQL